MVSISIFAIVAVVAIGALLKIVDANKKAQSLETSVNNLNFALDSITREMRVGTHYVCFGGSFADFSGNAGNSGCLGAGRWTVMFDSSEKSSKAGVTCALKYAYRYDGTTLTKAQQSSCDELDPTFYPIIADSSALDAKIHFDLALLTVMAVDLMGTPTPPYAQLHLKGYVGTKEKNKSTFDLQTTISQRLPD